MRIKGEEHSLAHLQIGEAAGLRQRYPELELRPLFMQQNGRVGAVK